MVLIALFGSVLAANVPDRYNAHGTCAPAMGTKSFRKPTDSASPALEKVSTDLSKFSELETSRLLISAR